MDLMQGNNVSFLDPRTKLALLITLPTFLMSGIGGEKLRFFVLIFSLLPFILLLISKNFLQFLIGFTIYTFTIVAWHYLSNHLNGASYLILYILYGIIIGLVPCILMGAYVMCSTTASEFIAGMEKLRFSTKITIPFTVMFRFFPTIIEEGLSINKAMKMRGIRIGNSTIFRLVEYRLIPVMMSCLRIGDELSAAALCRSLGAPIKRTNICTLKLKVQDFIVLALCISSYLVWAWSILYD